MYLLKPEMAEELRITESKIYQNSPVSLNDCDFIATVGDICTLKVSEEIRHPELCIVDMKTKRNVYLKESQREKMDDIGKVTVNVNSEPGTISDELWNAIELAVSEPKNTKIVVKGEEDLATLAVISMVKLGAKVIYGMPDKGMVVVDVNQQEKKRANSFLKRMLVD